MFEQIISIIAPHHCLSCKTEGQKICSACAEDLTLDDEICYACQKPSAKGLTHKECQRSAPLEFVLCASSYGDETSKELIHSLKFERVRSSSRLMADIMNNRLPNLHNDAVLVHIPTANRRVRIRGYDQAELIARHFAKRRKLPYHTLLVRIGDKRQVGADTLNRKRQAQSFFRAQHKELINGRHIILIDDVITTGASLNAAAEVLLRNGALSVGACLFARA